MGSSVSDPSLCRYDQSKGLAAPLTNDQQLAAKVGGGQSLRDFIQEDRGSSLQRFDGGDLRLRCIDSVSLAETRAKLALSDALARRDFPMPWSVVNSCSASKRGAVTFQMQIEEIFRLTDGRTLFTGVISGHAGAIGICDCELLDGQCTRQVVRCEGEPMVKKIDPSNRRRSIATTEAVLLSSEEARSGRWRLVCVC